MGVLSARHTALLLVDVVNHFEFPGGESLLDHAREMLGPLLALRRAAHARSLPVIYANDNFGDWHADSARIIRRCRGRGSRGASFVRKVAPSARDYFVLKPANSAFYNTALEPLLRSLGVRTLIIGGLSADNCVLFTAHDAYLRGYRLHVPSDCVASQSPADAERALEQMRLTLKASTSPSPTLTQTARRSRSATRRDHRGARRAQRRS